jgi:hypothetical protein
MKHMIRNVILQAVLLLRKTTLLPDSYYRHLFAEVNALYFAEIVRTQNYLLPPLKTRCNWSGGFVSFYFNHLLQHY